MARVTNSYGNTNKEIRRFLRENGVAPTMANVERIGREVRRSQTQNEMVERIAKETGRGGTYDEKGAVHPRVKERVRQEMAERERAKAHR